MLLLFFRMAVLLGLYIFFILVFTISEITAVFMQWQ